MRKLGFILAVAAAWILQSGVASAEPAYKADQIVNRFVPAMLGATRGLCIGTEAECSARKEAAAVTTFDLLVNFDHNSDVLTDGARKNLDEFAIALRDPRLKSASFVVEGHTDGKGSEVYNLGLSERRARAVVKHLAEKGVDTKKIQARGLGKAKPRAADPLDAVNRRVETRLRLD